MRFVVALLFLMLPLSGCLGFGDGSDAGADPALGPDEADTAPTPSGQEAEGTPPANPSSNATPEEPSSSPPASPPEARRAAWAAADTAELRPGAPIGWCTYGFFFEDTRTGQAYASTAGHCTEDVGERIPLEGAGEVGTVVYDSDTWEGADLDVDFALIALDEAWVARSSPDMIGFDGPTGYVTASDSLLGDLTGIHGHGMVLGDNAVTRLRYGVLASQTDKFWGAWMPTVFGDSGGAVMHVDSGQALGMVTGLAAVRTPQDTSYGPSVEFILNELHRAGFTDVTLATV